LQLNNKTGDTTMRKRKKQKGLVNSPVAMGLALFAGYGVFALAAAMNYAETGSPVLKKHHYPNLADVIEQAELEAEEYHKEQAKREAGKREAARKKKIKQVKSKNQQEVADTILFLYGDAEESKEAMLRLRSM